MPMHILVATDGSEVSRGAIRFGATLARGVSGRLTALYVALPGEDRHVAEQLLEAAKADAARSGVVAATRVETGDTVEAIAAAVREVPGDMLVVGTRGRGGLTRLLLGSVAEALCKEAPCPVAVVRQFDQAPTEMGPVLAPTDFSEGALSAGRVAARLAARLGVRVVLLHVLSEVVPAKGEDPAVTRRAALEMRREAEIRLRTQAEALGLDPEQTELSLVTGVDATQIAHTAKERGAGCIVMGTRGLTGLPKVFLGSVADQVLREAPCPVLVVPPGAASVGVWREKGR